MRNKQHEYIFKAFLESPIPTVIRKSTPELICIDSVIGGYCTQLLKSKKGVSFPSSDLISKSEKALFSDLINQSKGHEKNELIVYYRLSMLVVSILSQYMQQ